MGRFMRTHVHFLVAWSLSFRRFSKGSVSKNHFSILFASYTQKHKYQKLNILLQLGLYLFYQTNSQGYSLKPINFLYPGSLWLFYFLWIILINFGINHTCADILVLIPSNHVFLDKLLNPSEPYPINVLDCMALIER